MITLMAMGRGVQQSIRANIESLGSNLLFVTPGVSESGGGLFAFFGGSWSGGEVLTMDDAYALLDPMFAPSVAAVAPEKRPSNISGLVVARGKESFAEVLGVTAEYESVRNYSVESGAFISHGHVLNNSMVAVLGSTVAEELFGLRAPIGQTVRLNIESWRQDSPGDAPERLSIGRLFTVIGVLESRGIGMFRSADHQMLVPITAVHHRLSSEPTVQGSVQVDSINVQAVDSESAESAEREITTLLRLRHRITDESDFTVSNQQQTIETFEETTNVLVIFLGSIAGISLLVGGIGVMNIMLVSVTERTREIGIRKAMGAKRRDILLQFVAEASALSLTGGLVGLALGFGIAQALGGQEFFGPGQEFNMVVTGDIVMLAVIVSVGIGLFFGIYPAMRAARLHPIDALRYE